MPRPGRHRLWAARLDRQPHLVLGAHIDPPDRPGIRVRDEKRVAGDGEPGRLRAYVDGFADRLQCGRVQTNDVAAGAIGEPDASVGNDDPDRVPADVGARDRAGRRIDAQYLSRVGRRHPEIPVADGQPERPAARETYRGIRRRERRSIQTPQPAGPHLERPQGIAGLHDVIDTPVELASILVVHMRCSQSESVATAPVEGDQPARPESVVADRFDRGNQPPADACEGGNLPTPRQAHRARNGPPWLDRHGGAAGRPQALEGRRSARPRARPRRPLSLRGARATARWPSPRASSPSRRSTASPARRIRRRRRRRRPR